MGAPYSLRTGMVAAAIMRGQTGPLPGVELKYLQWLENIFDGQTWACSKRILKSKKPHLQNHLSLQDQGPRYRLRRMVLKTAATRYVYVLCRGGFSLAAIYTDSDNRTWRTNTTAIGFSKRPASRHSHRTHGTHCFIARFFPPRSIAQRSDQIKGFLHWSYNTCTISIANREHTLASLRSSRELPRYYYS